MKNPLLIMLRSYINFLDLSNFFILNSTDIMVSKVERKNPGYI